jgi:transcriptional regulator with XRE-family HTH domain
MKKSIYTQQQSALCELFREVRHSAGLNQAELSARLHKPQSFVSKYESGERRLDLLEVRQLCIALNISFRDFIIQLEEKLTCSQTLDS